MDQRSVRHHDSDMELKQELDRTALAILLEDREADTGESVLEWKEGMLRRFELGELDRRSIAAEAKKRGLPSPYFEDPIKRQQRLSQGNDAKFFLITMIFKPTG
jgi:hypothetical protein